MNRRSFFSIVAAAVVAPGALWALVKRPISRSYWFEHRFTGVGGSKSMTVWDEWGEFHSSKVSPTPKWRNFASTYTNVDKDALLELRRPAHAKKDWRAPKLTGARLDQLT
ncbi:hypothetical protein LCGC14_0589650 [marine sediment metagenome]|uniref:Uncharacterized protein n=1 Tax=marine sediment metagenome TaxID=412755 RepID=A0A0F9U009_9ZZZZ